ncbi:PIG-L deacetylase family protein [Streptomyces sp. LaPpAH-108]|uniref:PIG-L deacetylase family protein n=1 Tax=Streptomyces sp. LaPpAH-108 TaxID=1155714 RepID=UPI00037207DF|nr:PIG-L deacetylase family protein [Streptomyces sp. LaPpAH-108]
MTPPSLLAVFAHPDDESLVCGGVLARHAAAGARVTVVTTTWAPGTYRADELVDSVRALGAEPPRLLGYADDRVPDSAPGQPHWCDVPLDEAVARVVAAIRAARPEIVLTHDAYGGLTGHPDHRRTHQVTLLAAAAAGLGDLHPEAGEPWQPRAVYLATHPDTALTDLVPLLARARKSVLAVPQHQVSAVVDVRPWRDRKWAAILAHRSQVERERPLPGILARLPAATRHRIIGTEYYLRVGLVPASPPLTDLTA